MAVPGAAFDRFRGRWPTLRQPPPPGHLLDLPSARVHVQVRGSGPTLVYLPDPPNGLDTVAPFLDRLAERHRVVAFELVGFGWSRPRGRFGFTVDDHARVLQEVLVATESPRATLVAPCLGGFIALVHACRHPDAVERLVLPQVPEWRAAQAWADRVDRGRRLRRGWLGQAAALLAQDLIARRWYGVAEPDDARRGSLLQVHAARPRAGRHFPIASGLLSLDGPDPTAGCPDLTIPTLLMWGDGDPSHPRDHAHTLAPRVPHAGCHTVPAGHFCDLSHPDLLLAWLDATSAASAP